MDLFDNQLLDKIGTGLLKQKTTISVAESVTSGLLQFAFSSIENASSFFQGGITAYNLGQKYKHLEVEPIFAQEVNCVSQEVAIQMARHVITIFHSDWGIGITGYATPVTEGNNKLFAYFGIHYKDKLISSGRLLANEIIPQQVQLYYTTEVLKRFQELI